MQPVFGLHLTATRLTHKSRKLQEQSDAFAAEPVVNRRRHGRPSPIATGRHTFIFPTGRGSKLQGTVKWFNNSKGYSFIGHNDGPDVFVHYSAIVGEVYRTSQEGDCVKCEIAQSPRGPQAANVQKVGQQPSS